MRKLYKADLHIHTCLSPCGELTMLPRDIVRVAKSQQVDIIGICDHNSAENVAAVIEVGRQEKIGVLPGLEVTSKEEVHLLGLFESAESALQLQEQVYAHLPGQNNPDVFGIQLVVDSQGEPVEVNSRLLIGATTLSVEEIIELIHQLDGLVIAAHIDRPSFSIISQLGIIPEQIALDGLEISSALDYDTACQRFPECRNYPVISSSDAHTLDALGKATTGIYLTEPSFPELKRVFQERKMNL
ncbi:MAG: PHP-associated domain-containing protein [bacterium]|nr:PHP-associated domain-containing protein [bacterium]